MSIYQHHVLAIPPKQHGAIANRIKNAGVGAIADKGGRLFGIWKPLLGLSLGQGGGRIRTDEARLLGIEGAGPEPRRPRGSDFLIGPRMPGGMLVRGEELLTLLHSGDFAGQPCPRPYRGCLTRDGRLRLGDDTVPVVHDVQASIAPA